MRVAVFRTQEDGEKTALAIAARGHEAVLTPVMAVVSTGARLPEGKPDAIVFTSRNGVLALAGDPGLARLSEVPCFCVGEATAREAKRFNFSDARVARGSAVALVETIQQTVPAGSSLLFVTGRHRKPDVERELGPTHHIQVVEVYEARAVENWLPRDSAMLLDGTVSAALHYSVRSASLAIDLARKAGALETMLRLRHHCLAPEIAAPLREVGAERIIVAPEPTEASLLATL